ncbi:MAG: hypothetical protein COB37_11980 [Kordiimonadales bacterium]|nr:MAG: hypothetical protein COB37_11980 [Kordiimonadales bacterium]
MDKKNDGKNLIGMAIMWAAALLAGTLLMDDSDKQFVFLIIMVSSWIVVIATVGSTREAARAECRMFRRLLGRGPKAES